ncbi:MAG: hypothetical protein QXU46_04795 [Candidatus Bathyarchaeia archaeon]
MKKKENYVFPIEEKLAKLEWNLKLLNTSITTTHTPIRTIKSMLKGNVVLPTVQKLEKIANL